MSGRSVLLRFVLLLAVPLMLTSHSAAETPKLSVSEADDACARYAGVYVSKIENEREVKDKVPVWKFKCEHHPHKATCDDALETIQMVRGGNSLKCGQPVIVIQSPPPARSEPKALPPVNPKIAEADDACARFAGTYISKTENEPEVRVLVPVWKSKCEQHPYKPTCDDTADTIEMVRHFRALTCVGGSPNR
jgi:hypothetical protein